MNYRYKLEKDKDGNIEVIEYKTLKEISKDLNIELHLVRRIYHLTEN